MKKKLTCRTVVVLLLSLIFMHVSYADKSSTERSFFNDSEIRRISSFGPWPTTMPPDAGNEFSGIASIEKLGEKLFSDTDLSGNKTLSCKSCHQAENGFADQIPLAQGAQQHVRNTQGLMDIGMQRWFGWDGGADSLWSATLRPMLSEIEMAGDIKTIAARLRTKHYLIRSLKQSLPHYDAFNLSDEELVVLAAKAIAAYMRTLKSGTTAFDRYYKALANNDIDGQRLYPAAAKRGLKTFIGEANCHVCHFGPNFSNGEFHDTGRPFFTGIGKVDSGRYSGIKRVRDDRYNLLGKYNGTSKPNEIRKTSSVKLVQDNFGQWRTPSLRNLKLTAPYMHDGSLSTLREVVDAYADIDISRLHSKGESILKPLDLSSRQRDDLVAFLKSLSEQ